jgi:hypothetical protein
MPTGSWRRLTADRISLEMRLPDEGGV